MRSTECRKEVVQCRLIRQIDDGEAQSQPLAVRTEKIVVPDCYIKEVSRLYSSRIVIIVLRARSWDFDARGSILRWRAGGQGVVQCCDCGPAEKSCLLLLVRRQTRKVHGSRCIVRERNGSSHK